MRRSEEEEEFAMATKRLKSNKSADCTRLKKKFSILSNKLNVVFNDLSC